MSTNPRGFTLIEALVYLGLFALLIGGTFTGAFNVIESSGRNQAHAMMQEEGNFIVGKINWALSGASTISQPATTGSKLTVSKYDGSSVTIDINNTDVEIQDVVNTTPTVVNSTNVQVSNLVFTHTEATGDGIDPEKVVATFTLSTHAPNGMVITQDFSTTAYLRR